jgi:hypothetical protein
LVVLWQVLGYLAWEMVGAITQLGLSIKVPAFAPL